MLKSCANWIYTIKVQYKIHGLEVCYDVLFSKFYKDHAVKLSDEIGVKKSAVGLIFRLTRFCAGSKERRKEMFLARFRLICATF